MILHIQQIVDAALADWQALRDSGKWATLDINPDWVRLTYGAILSDDTEEREIATRTYYMDESGVRYTTAVHP